MTLQNSYTLDVDFKKSSYINEPIVTQNDQVKFILNVFDDDVPFDLSTVTTFTLASLRSDKQSVMTLGVKTATNQIIFELGSTEVAKVGKVNAAIQLYDADGRVSTLPFTYQVIRDLITDYVPSQNEKTLIELVLTEAPIIIANAIEATELATLATEDAILATDASIIATNNANTATDLANTATTNANTATNNAINATNDTIQATSDANTVKDETIQATTNTITATANANARITTMNEKIDEVNTVLPIINTAISDANTATTNANTAKDNAIVATTNAINATTNANTATTNANLATSEATTQASYAKAQGDYAKSQGDLINDILQDGAVQSVNGQTGIVTGLETVVDSDSKLSNKVDKVAGKQLSTNDYTTTEKNKLAGIETGAQVNTVTSVNGKLGEVVIPNASLTEDGLMTSTQATKLSGIQSGANYVNVVDNTTSTSTTSALSANQGKIVSDKITVLTQDLGSKTSLNTTNKTNVVSAVNEINTNLTSEVNRLTTQLAQKANYEEVRLKSVKVELEDASEEFLSAMSGNASFSLESVPQNKSVTLNKLSDGVMDVISTNKNGSDYTWEIGSISDNFGYIATDGKKIRTDYIKVSKGTVVTNLDPNNHLRCFKYHRPTSAEFFGYEEVTSSIEVEKDCYIRLRSGYNPPVDLSEGDKVNLANKVSLDIIISFKNEIEEVKEMSRTFKKTLSWVLGTVNTSLYHQIPSTNRIITPDYIKVLKGTTVLLSDVENHMYAVNKFTSDHHTTHFEDTGWLDSERYVIDEDCYIKIIVRDKANGDISDVNLYGSVISLNIPISTKFDYVDEILGNTQTTYKNTLDAFVKAVAHRGLSTTAPENTLPAYKMAKDKGFSYVECDVEWTSDGVPVLLHDDTIDRTSNGSGNINDMTLSAVKSYDFGSWKSSEYAGTKIPTFEEFILLCKKLNLHPYIEVKGTIDSTQVDVLINIVKKLGMIKNVTWISFGLNNLNLILASVPTARIGYVSNTISNSIIDSVSNIKTDENDVFLDINHSSVTKELVQSSQLQGMSVEVWTVNSSELVNALVEKGISGITTDHINVAEILAN